MFGDYEFNTGSLKGSLTQASSQSDSYNRSQGLNQSMSHEQEKLRAIMQTGGLLY
jgi:hypothetical protein